MVEHTPWREIEYQQANEFVGKIFDSMFSLARMSFVFNGIMFGSVSFIVSDKMNDTALDEQKWIIGFVISMFSISYNYGALSAFLLNVKVWMSLHEGLKQFESKMEELTIKIHSSIISDYAKAKKFGVQHQTAFFFSILIFVWTVSGIFWSYQGWLQITG